MSLARAALRLTRPDSSLLAFLSVLLPLLSRTHDLVAGLKKAVPLLFISICTFLLNDLDDLEKDKINHPDRPLPRGQVKPAFVAALYYVSLAFALLATRFYIDSTYAAFWYYLLLTASISYSYVVEFLPGFKSLYVAGAVSIPILIVLANYPEETGLYRLGAAIALFTLGRELCMDLCDRRGDPVSFLHTIEPVQVAVAAFTLQGAGLILVLWQVVGLADLLLALVMLSMLAVSCLLWFTLHRPKAAIAVMKAVMFCGLYFLL